MQQRCSEKEEGIRFKGTELAREANKQAGIWSPTAGCASSRVRPYSHWRFVSSVSRAEVMVLVMGEMYRWSRQGLEEGDVIWLQKEDLEFWVESEVTTEGRPGALDWDVAGKGEESWAAESVRLSCRSRLAGLLSLASPLRFERVRECSSGPCGMACHSSIRTMSDFGKVPLPLGICLLSC